MSEVSYQQKAFDAQAKTYEKLYGGQSNFERGMLRERERIILNSKKVETSLDLGCGTGTFLKLISKRSKKVFGVDISPKMIQESINKTKQEKLSNVEIRLGNAYELDFESNFFDRVYCINTFCHIKDSKKAIGEISRVLKKDGIAYIEFYDILNLFVFVRSFANPFFRGHPFVYGNFIPFLKKFATDNDLEVESFNVVSYIETGDAIKKWLPSSLFVFLKFYKRIAEKISFLQFTRCVIELRKTR